MGEDECCWAVGCLSSGIRICTSSSSADSQASQGWEAVCWATSLKWQLCLGFGTWTGKQTGFVTPYFKGMETSRTLNSYSTLRSCGETFTDLTSQASLEVALHFLQGRLHLMCASQFSRWLGHETSGKNLRPHCPLTLFLRHCLYHAEYKFLYLHLVCSPVVTWAPWSMQVLKGNGLVNLTVVILVMF